VGKAHYKYGPQFSVGRGILSRAAEFALCHGSLTFPRNFAESEKWPLSSTIIGVISVNLISHQSLISVNSRHES